MKSLTQNIFAKKPSQKLKILTFPTHEGYQSLLDKTGHDFFMLTGTNLKQWDFQTRELPPNHYMITTPWDKAKVIEDIDLVLCQNRDFQFDLASSISRQYQIPMLQIEHTQPPYQCPDKHLALVKQRQVAQCIYITEFSKNAWQDENGIVIPHGIDTDIFRPRDSLSDRKGGGVSMVNKFPHRDIFCGWNLWQETTKQHGVNVTLIGDNPGLSKSINDPRELCRELNSHLYFLNTSQWSPVPLSMLEAMACGLPVVSTAKQEIPKIIKSGYNGYLADTAAN